MEEISSPFCEKLKKILCNGPFMLICVALSFLYFIITGIQYWVSDYLMTTLSIPETTVFISFSIISITGPVFGVVVGGNLCTYLGGFRAKASLYMVMFFSLLCLFSAAPIAFLDNFYLFVTLLWFLLFFGGAILPSMTGIMLNTVEGELKTVANSVANLTYQFLGYLPAPTVYGLIYDMNGGGNGRMAMATLMFTPIVSVTCLYLACCIIFSRDLFNFKLQQDTITKIHKSQRQ